MKHDDELTRLRRENRRMRLAIRWALGEVGSFGEEPPPLAGKYRQRYWWRSELRRRAFGRVSSTGKASVFSSRGPEPKP